MKQIFTKNSRERALFIDFWNLCQDYWVPEDTDEYWKDLIAGVDEFAKKHSWTQLSASLASTLIIFLEEKLKEGKR